MIVWMIIGMIKAHPTKNRMARRARVAALFVGASGAPLPLRRP
jgi:hypothetical protein